MIYQGQFTVDKPELWDDSHGGGPEVFVISPPTEEGQKLANAKVKEWLEATKELYPGWKALMAVPSPAPVFDTFEMPRIWPHPLIQYFAYSHLPKFLQDISKPFGRMAVEMIELVGENPETDAFLRKLLEAKDCAVRAKLWKDPAILQGPG